jgi:hypothetical protein
MFIQKELLTIEYQGVEYACESINGYVFAPPELAFLSEIASESDAEIHEDSLISYYLQPDEVDFLDCEKLELIGVKCG